MMTLFISPGYLQKQWESLHQPIKTRKRDSYRLFKHIIEPIKITFALIRINVIGIQSHTGPLPIPESQRIVFATRMIDFIVCTIQQFGIISTSIKDRTQIDFLSCNFSSTFSLCHPAPNKHSSPHFRDILQFHYKDFLYMQDLFSAH